jgi:NitT/TauT family transport system substrate-binding protein
LESEGHRVHSLLVAKDSPIDKIADLAGKKVAINTLGNINELSMIALADAASLDISKINLVEVPFPQMGAALKNGFVDAVLAVEPFVTLNISHGTARFLDKSVHKVFGDQFMIGGWFAKKSWVEENPQLASAFIKAINSASDFIAANPQQIPSILVNHTKLVADLASEITVPAFSSKFDQADLQRMIDASARYGFIKASFDAGDIMYGQ